MPAERTIYVHDRRRTPLALRARFEWTFFGVGLFAAVNLFLLGFFLLVEAIRDPLAASTTGIVGAAFMLALAAFLLAYLAWPRFKAAFGMQACCGRPHTFRRPTLTDYGNNGALQTQIEAEQALTLDTQFPTPLDVNALRRARERTGSAPQAGSDDAVRVRQ
jgi:hypothetical protein